jgi:hypothetical protein
MGRRRRSYCRAITPSTVLLGLVLTCVRPGGQSLQKSLAQEFWEVHPDFATIAPQVVAVMPMTNMTVDLEASRVLQNAVYERLQAKGYRRIDAGTVAAVMARLGIQTPEMLSGVSTRRLGTELRADAVIQGEVNQSGTQHAGVYDAVVVSCSLRLVLCKTGQVLWSADQWRTAHRQFQADPFNFIINMVSHEGASRPARIEWLAQEMLRTLPPGPVRVVTGDLLAQAVEVRAEPESAAPAAAPAPSYMVTVYFEEGASAVTADAEPVLSHLVPVLAAGGDIEVVITGYRHAGEPDEGARRLGMARGQACLDWLAGRVPGAAGRSRVREGATGAPDPGNRRVEIAVTRRVK